MGNIPILGISDNYTPLSSCFCVEVYNLEININQNLDYLTKISCNSSAFVENRFQSLDSNYSSVYLNVDLRIDYINNNRDMNFHMVNLDKFLYVKTENLNKKNFNVDSEILDMDVIDVKDNKVFIYLLVMVCLY